jgi:hypothetical protein
MSLFADELALLDANINLTIYRIEKQEKLLNSLVTKHSKLDNYRKNYKSFLARYAAFIGGPDGIFGILSDEIIVQILSYLHPKYLLHGYCRRLYKLRDYALDSMSCIIPKTIINKCVNILRIPKIIIYTHAKRRSDAKLPYVPGKLLNLVLSQTYVADDGISIVTTYKYSISEDSIIFYMTVDCDSLVKLVTLYDDYVHVNSSEDEVVVCKDLGFRIVDEELNPIDMHPMFNLYNKRVI